jgi:D-aspartate ligase
MPSVPSIKSGCAKAAVILGAGENGLGAIRSLREAGVPTIIVGFRRSAPGLLSRYPVRRLFARPSGDVDEVILSALETIREDRPVLIPTADLYVSFMIRNRDRLASRFDFCIPPSTLAETLLDKAKQYRLIADVGIPMPKTVVSLRGQWECLGRALGFPIIVKPRRWADTRALEAKNRVVKSEEELRSLLAKYDSQLDRFLAQEVIPGGDCNQWVCNCTFGRDHKLIGAFVFRRLRLSPAHRGVTSYAISEGNPEVLSLVARLGTALQYVGPAMIEFKWDPRDGAYKYLELNPRIGLCNYFDTTCGVNNVYYTYALAVGKEVKKTRICQRDGLMYLSLLSDFYSRMKDGEKLGSILCHYLANAARPHVGAYLDWRDPFPGIITALRQAPWVVRSTARRILALFTNAAAGLLSSSRRSHNSRCPERGCAAGRGCRRQASR